MDQRSFNTYAGWVLPYDQPIYLIIDEDKLEQAVQDLLYVGIDNVAGYITPDELQFWTGQLKSFPLLRPNDVEARVKNGEVHIVDVRSVSEFEEGHLPQAVNVPLTGILDNLNQVPRNGKDLLVSCRSGGRSFVAATLLQARGFDSVINLAGGFTAWRMSKLPIE